MAVSQRTRYELGDEVSNGSERGVIVLSDFAGTKGKRLPMVKITTGDRTGKKVWPWERPHRWFPLLDYEPKTGRYQCTSCDREYWAPDRKGWCLQCVRKDEGDRRQGTTMAGPGRRFASDGTGHEILPAPAPRADRDDSPF